MEKMDFLSKKEGEEILLVVRQHPWVFFLPTIEIIIILAVSVFVFVTYKTNIVTTWMTLIVIAIIIYILVRSWFVWWNQSYVITNERVIAVDQNGWFNRSVSESTLENILFINHAVKGPMHTLLNFGDVHVRASGVSEDELVFANVSNPYEIQQIIVKAQREKMGSSEKGSDNVKQKALLR